MRIKQKLIISFLLVVFISLISAVGGIIFILNLNQTGEHVAIVLAPQVDACMEIKLELTTGHLWFEELMGGDASIKPEKVYGLFNNASWFAGALIKGGTNLVRNILCFRKRRINSKSKKYSEKYFKIY